MGHLFVAKDAISGRPGKPSNDWHLWLRKTVSDFWEY
jgi:hypothetical protein